VPGVKAAATRSRMVLAFQNLLNSKSLWEIAEGTKVKIGVHSPRRCQSEVS
jgi:hypothetical protein